MKKSNIEKARAYRRKHYYNNKEVYIERAKATKKRVREYANIMKDKCVLCGETEKVCLDFHHLKDKGEGVNKLIQKCSLKRVKEEIEKCVVLCSNCHRKLHAGIAQLVE